MLIIRWGTCSRVTSILLSSLLGPTVSILSVDVSRRCLLCKDVQNVVSQSVSQGRWGLLVWREVVVEAPVPEVVCDHVFKCCPVWSVAPADLVPLPSKSIRGWAGTVTSSTLHTLRGSILKFTKRKESHFVSPHPFLFCSDKSVFDA